MALPAKPPTKLPTDGRHITYTLQYRKCGKQKRGHCRACEQGPGHGPYWFAYYRDPGPYGKLHSAYVGKERPDQGGEETP